LDLNGNSLTYYSYDDFLNNFVNNGTQKEIAKKVLQIFNNEFPVFNYKYSDSTDIGDLDKMVATYSKLGDYNPVTMNGSHTVDSE